MQVRGAPHRRAVASTNIWATATARCSTIRIVQDERREQEVGSTTSCSCTLSDPTKICHVVRINSQCARGATRKDGTTSIWSMAGLSDATQDQLLCRDSILARANRARPALFLDLAARRHVGHSEWLSFYSRARARRRSVSEHDSFIQLMKLKNTLRYLKGEELITYLGPSTRLSGGHGARSR